MLNMILRAQGQRQPSLTSHADVWFIYLQYDKPENIPNQINIQFFDLPTHHVRLCANV